MQQQNIITLVHSKGRNKTPSKEKILQIKENKAI
jgi:hypothetical protein